MQKAFCGSRPYFNPRSPWGERHSFCRPFRAFRLFQSTLPVGGATFCPHWFTFSVLFQSTLPVGGATKLERTTKECAEISIHAPRGGSDHLLRGMPPQGEISIHAPRGGSDPPLWQSCRPVSYFNPRSPWGERQREINNLEDIQIFQSTLPVGGATCHLLADALQLGQFQSTLPVGGATKFSHAAIMDAVISIHAPRGGSDLVTQPGLLQKRLFQSTLPVGGATRCVLTTSSAAAFPSTLPVGGATSQQRYSDLCVSISIHAPRGGSDTGLPLRTGPQV